MQKFKVYISQGPYTDLHRSMCDKLADTLKISGCDPVTVGANAYGIKSTIEQVRDHMDTCAGAVIIAFRRFHLNQASEKPDSPDEKPVDGRYLPSVWNQLEAAMAYGRDLPLLIIIENGVHDEGMLSEKTGYKPIIADLDMRFLNSEQFMKTMEDWLGRVESRGHDRKVNASDLTLVNIFRSLSIKQWWAVAGAFATILSSVAAVAYKIGEALAKP